MARGTGLAPRASRKCDRWLLLDSKCGHARPRERERPELAAPSDNNIPASKESAREGREGEREFEFADRRDARDDAGRDASLGHPSARTCSPLLMNNVLACEPPTKKLPPM